MTSTTSTTSLVDDVRPASGRTTPTSTRSRPSSSTRRDRGDRGGRGGHRRLRGCRPRDRRRSGRPRRGRAADVGGQASERHHDRGQSSTVAIRDRGPCQGRRFEMVRHRDGRRLRPHPAERHPAGEWGLPRPLPTPTPSASPSGESEREPERFGEPEWFGQPERGPSGRPERDTRRERLTERVLTAAPARRPGLLSVDGR